MTYRLSILIFMCLSSIAYAAPLTDLQRQYQDIIEPFPGRVGVCSYDGTHLSCVNGDQQFSMQSVVKLLTGMAVWDAVDRGQFQSNDPIPLDQSNLTGGVEPIADLIGDHTYTTTIDDLVQRMIIDSDNAAHEVMMDKLGGPAAVQAFLDRKGITGIRVDSDERRLQSRVNGLEWKADYAAPGEFQRAIDAVPKSVRDTAYHAYQTDPRDTATPAGMAILNYKLAHGDVLSVVATRALIDTMLRTKTFPSRLRSGLQHGWQIGHKTGSSNSWNGVTAATNDVGFMITPQGQPIGIAVFVADSTARAAERDAIIARLSRATIDYYNQHKL